MVVGDRLRQLREQKNLSQGDIEERTGLLRCYVSRVENGHTVPAIDTLEKFARALEIPMYQLLYEGEGIPEIPQPVKRKVAREVLWGTSGKDASHAQQSSAASSAACRKKTAACSSTWPRKCSKRPPNEGGRPERSAAKPRDPFRRRRGDKAKDGRLL